MSHVSSNPDRGSVIVADLVIGASLVLILASAATAAGLVIDAAQSSREAARSAAVELARGNGPAPALRRARRLSPPGARIDYEVVDREVRVRVDVEVELPHPIYGSARVRVGALAEVPIAPFRSW
jgi:hypothetical protein